MLVVNVLLHTSQRLWITSAPSAISQSYPSDVYFLYDLTSRGSSSTCSNPAVSAAHFANPIIPPKWSCRHLLNDCGRVCSLAEATQSAVENLLPISFVRASACSRSSSWVMPENRAFPTPLLFSECLKRYDDHFSSLHSMRARRIGLFGSNVQTIAMLKLLHFLIFSRLQEKLVIPRGTDGGTIVKRYFVNIEISAGQAGVSHRAYGNISSFIKAENRHVFPLFCQLFNGYVAAAVRDIYERIAGDAWICAYLPDIAILFAVFLLQICKAARGHRLGNAAAVEDAALARTTLHKSHPFVHQLRVCRFRLIDGRVVGNRAVRVG